MRFRVLSGCEMGGWVGVILTLGRYSTRAEVDAGVGYFLQGDFGMDTGR